MTDFIDATHYMQGEEVVNVSLNRDGALNKALMTRLTEMSNADNWEEAKEEWRATGEVWYVPLRYRALDHAFLPEIHMNNHPSECVCGHPIAWHFEVENTENGIKEILGSEHITNWMIIRHLKEIHNIPADAITEDKIIEWMKEAVKSMKCDWWWKENGEDWEEMFNEVKELDIRINVRSKGKYYDQSTKRYEPHMTIAKTKSGSLGRMASVVWRWNHPDNDRKQIETRGYPNEKLWRDVQLLFAKSQRFEKQLDVISEEVEQRKNYIIEQNKQAHYDNVIRITRIKEEASKIRTENKEKYDNDALQEACEYYDIPMFGIEDGNGAWEKKFLNDMSNRIIKRQTLSIKQLNALLNIIDKDNVAGTPASDKQINYIKKLGGEPPENITKSRASEMITELLRD
jgi:hypothetical protein